MASANPDLAGEPGHCCLCGARNLWCLCRRCLTAHRVDGVLPEWVRVERRVAQKKTKEEQRHPLRFEPLGEDW